MNITFITIVSLWISYAIYTASLAHKTAEKILSDSGYSQVKMKDNNLGYFKLDGCEPDAPRVSFEGNYGSERKEGYVCINLILNDKIITN